MEPLPRVDEHAVEVPAGRERTWEALLRVVGSDLSGSPRFARLLGAHPAGRSGDWSRDPGGATLPGFEVVEARRPERLELRGRHRFSVYRLTFSIGGGEVRARTDAAFPGLRGRLYRALVIGSGAHRFLVRRLLRRVAAAAAAAR